MGSCLLGGTEGGYTIILIVYKVPFIDVITQYEDMIVSVVWLRRYNLCVCVCVQKCRTGKMPELT